MRVQVFFALIAVLLFSSSAGADAWQKTKECYATPISGSGNSASYSLACGQFKFGLRAKCEIWRGNSVSPIECFKNGKKVSHEKFAPELADKLCAAVSSVNEQKLFERAYQDGINPRSAAWDNPKYSPVEAVTKAVCEAAGETYLRPDARKGLENEETPPKKPSFGKEICHGKASSIRCESLGYCRWYLGDQLWVMLDRAGSKTQCRLFSDEGREECLVPDVSQYFPPSTNVETVQDKPATVFLDENALDPNRKYRQAGYAYVPFQDEFEKYQALAMMKCLPGQGQTRSRGADAGEGTGGYKPAAPIGGATGDSSSGPGAGRRAQ